MNSAHGEKSAVKSTLPNTNLKQNNTNSGTNPLFSSYQSINENIESSLKCPDLGPQTAESRQKHQFTDNRFSTLRTKADTQKENAAFDTRSRDDESQHIISLSTQNQKETTNRHTDTSTHREQGKLTHCDRNYEEGSERV